MAELNAKRKLKSEKDNVPSERLASETKGTFVSEFISGLKYGSKSSASWASIAGMLVGSLSVMGCSAGITAVCVVPLIVQGL